MNNKEFCRNIDLKTALYELLEVVSAHNPKICEELMEEGFIKVMIRELNGNKYLVEKTLYGDVMENISDGDIEDDLLLEPTHTLNHILTDNKP